LGVVKNAADTNYVPGGSSGGSAVAVQADMCFASLGSDTGGSIRQPASFCGLVGSKATYGKISRWGLLSYASSFDQIGALTHNVKDNALLTQLMAGHDERDATSSQQPVGEYLPLEKKNKKLKIAYLGNCIEHEGVDTEIKKAALGLIEKMKADGHTLTSVSFPNVDQMVPCYYVLTTAEASSNLARYSGLTFGYRSENSHDLESTFTLSRTEGFGPEVKRRIMLGTFVLSSNYYDAYYTKAQKVRQIIKQKTEEILAEYDFIILPTTSTPAFKIGEKAENPIAMYLADLFTVQANLSGNPAISIPLGKKGKLPFGLQIIAAHHKEKEMFELAQDLEKPLT
jgi:aspartyl-tRNA(Asn)/glutamyl-tRNA(Gln) amidotransferase subunit A